MNDSRRASSFNRLKRQADELFSTENFDKGKSFGMNINENCSQEYLDEKSVECLKLVSGHGFASEKTLKRHAKIVDGKLQSLSGMSAQKAADADVEIVTVTITLSRFDQQETSTEIFEFRQSRGSDDNIG